MATRVILRGEYDVWRHDELRGELEKVDRTQDVTIDLSAVTLLDAGSVALLIALKKRLNERAPEANVILLNAPPIVKRVIELCGAAQLFVFAADR